MSLDLTSHFTFEDIYSSKTVEKSLAHFKYESSLQSKSIGVDDPSFKSRMTSFTSLGSTETE